MVTKWVPLHFGILGIYLGHWLRHLDSRKKEWPLKSFEKTALHVASWAGVGVAPLTSRDWLWPWTTWYKSHSWTFSTSHATCQASQSTNHMAKVNEARSINRTSLGEWKVITFLEEVRHCNRTDTIIYQDSSCGKQERKECSVRISQDRLSTQNYVNIKSSSNQSQIKSDNSSQNQLISETNTLSVNVIWSHHCPLAPILSPAKLSKN